MSAVNKRRRPWWLMTDRPEAAWLPLPPLLLMSGILIGQAVNRGDTLALVVAIAVAAIAIGHALVAYVYYRRHPEQIKRDRPAEPLTRKTRLLLAVGVIVGWVCAVTGLITLIAGNGPLGAVLFIVGLIPALVCGSTLGVARR